MSDNLDVRDEGTTEHIADGEWSVPGILDKIRDKMDGIIVNGRTADLTIHWKSRKT